MVSRVTREIHWFPYDETGTNKATNIYLPAWNGSGIRKQKTSVTNAIEQILWFRHTDGKCLLIKKEKWMCVINQCVREIWSRNGNQSNEMIKSQCQFDFESPIQMFCQCDWMHMYASFSMEFLEFARHLCSRSYATVRWTSWKKRWFTSNSIHFELLPENWDNGCTTHPVRLLSQFPLLFPAFYIQPTKKKITQKL